MEVGYATSMLLAASYSTEWLLEVSMNRLLLTLAIVGSLLSSNPTAAQVLPPAKRAERVEITKAPELELATDQLTIIRWTTNNPGGSDVHYGIVHYGTDPQDLNQT